MRIRLGVGGTHRLRLTGSDTHGQCRSSFLLLAVSWHLGDLHRDIMAHDYDVFHKQLAAT
jgi:hypothetical protein